jgi:hypothetical protein
MWDSLLSKRVKKNAQQPRLIVQDLQHFILYNISVINPHWFQRGTGTSIFGQCGSGVLMTKNRKKFTAKIVFILYFFDQICHLRIPWPP